MRPCPYSSHPVQGQTPKTEPTIAKRIHSNTFIIYEIVLNSWG